LSLKHHPLAARRRRPQSMPLDYEAFIYAKMRCSGSVFSLTFARSPRRVSSSYRSSKSILRIGSPTRSARGVAASVFGCPMASAASFSVFPMNSGSFGLPPDQTCPRSRATCQKPSAPFVLRQVLPLVLRLRNPKRSAHDFSCLGLRLPVGLDSSLRRLSNESLVRSSPIEPTCSRFEPRLGCPVR